MPNGRADARCTYVAPQNPTGRKRPEARRFGSLQSTHRYSGAISRSNRSLGKPFDPRLGDQRALLIAVGGFLPPVHVTLTGRLRTVAAPAALLGLLEEVSTAQQPPVPRGA
jgi:hypothetical protein